MLALELTSHRPAVRVGVKRALHDLAVVVYPTERDPAHGVSRLLYPWRFVLKQAILGKPFHHSPVTQQVRPCVHACACVCMRVCVCV